MIPQAVNEMWLTDHASRSLGMEIVDAGTGWARVRMTITEAMINGHEVAHGGYLFLLADSAFACACNSYGPVALAAGADITFVAPARLGDLLEARAIERVRYGRSGVYDVTVYRGDEVVAEFRGRSRTVGSSAQQQEHHATDHRAEENSDNDLSGRMVGELDPGPAHQRQQQHEQQ
jgi:acyl-CoA thioesterase